MPTPTTTLHLLDTTTPPTACDMLAQLLANSPATTHHLAALGHRSTTRLLDSAGITLPINFLPGLGWADPSTHRALTKLLNKLQPTHLHTWGLPATLAASLSRPSNSPRRIATLAEPPAPRHLRPLKLLQHIKPRTENCRFHFTITNTAITATLTAAGIDPARITHIPPAMPQITTPLPDPATLREQLGLTPEDFPLILLAGEGGDPATRHDYGLWTAAILSMIFPRVRAIAREDPRTRPDPGLDRMADNLHNEDVPLILPAEFTWQQLLTIADLFLITADHPIALGDTLMAMAAGVPVLAPPLDPHDSLRQLLIDGETALIAAEPKPKSLTARAEKFLSHPELRTPLINRARTRVTEHYSPEKMLRAFSSIYQSEFSDRSSTAPPPVLHPALLLPH